MNSNALLGKAQEYLYTKTTQISENDLISPAAGISTLTKA
jgi:hypothetical protein